MTLNDFKALGGKELYYPPQVPPSPPEGYEFKRIYHMGKLAFYRLQEIIKKKPCNC